MSNTYESNLSSQSKRYGSVKLLPSGQVLAVTTDIRVESHGSFARAITPEGFAAAEAYALAHPENEIEFLNSPEFYQEDCKVFWTAEDEDGSCDWTKCAVETPSGRFEAEYSFPAEESFDELAAKFGTVVNPKTGEELAYLSVPKEYTVGEIPYISQARIGEFPAHVRQHLADWSACVGQKSTTGVAISRGEMKRCPRCVRRNFSVDQTEGCVSVDPKRGWVQECHLN